MNHRVRRIAQPCGILRDYIQYWLNIRRRAGDDTQISLVAVCCSKRFLEFLEQPDVLDGDDGLVGEGFEQLDLLFREWANLGSANQDSTNGYAFAQ